MKLYEMLADTLRENIQQGLFQSGDKLPSVRQLAGKHKVSISTVQEAYRHLEMEGLVEARAKSGYFVLAHTPEYKLPQTSRPPQRPTEVSQWQEVLDLLLSNDIKGAVQLQHATPIMDISSIKPLLKKMGELTRHNPQLSLPYGDVRGIVVLREQISKLTQASGCQLHPDDIVVTSGCQEALSVCRI